MNRHYRFLFSLLIPLSASAEKNEAVWKGPDKPVYVVTQNHYAVGFTPEGATPRFEDLIAIEIIGGEMGIINISLQITRKRGITGNTKRRGKSIPAP